MSRRRTRLPPRFAVGAQAPGEGFDVPAQLGTTPGRPPKVHEYLKEHPGGILEPERSPRTSWPAVVIFLGLTGLVGLALSKGRR